MTNRSPQLLAWPLAFLVLILTVGYARAASSSPLPPPDQWDGHTKKARLDRPYEDHLQAYIPFGSISYFLEPWRAYMDTWPASHFIGSMGVNMNTDPSEMDAVMQLLDEAGIRKFRTEMGWGNMDWNDQMNPNQRASFIAELKLAKKHHLRPMILLNAHHAAPGPTRDVAVQFTADAKKGDRVLKVRPVDVAKIHVGYTGPWDVADYCSANPLITAVKPDGTCTLSQGLFQDLKAGPYNLRELKYLPLHGSDLKGADAEANRALDAASTAMRIGWSKYVNQVCDVAMEGLGTKGQPDAGFDVEVWNEQTFGSNSLDLGNYYNPRLLFGKPPTYDTTRPVGPGMRPDAKTNFHAEGCMVLLGWTVDLVRARPELAHVMVDDGLGNQWPWNTSADAWPGQDAYSRHYYTGGHVDISPATVRNDWCTFDGLGHMDGKRPEHPRDWGDIVPNTAFAPTVRVGLPEFCHTGFKTESLTRDVLPDVRWGGDSEYKHGRYTHNGDFHTMELWQTEVNYDRSQFFGDLQKSTGTRQDDPRAYALDSFIAGKMTLRQYLFHNHKGLRDLFIFATSGGTYQFGFFEPPFDQALAAAKGQLTGGVRKQVPGYMTGLGWIEKQMESGEPIAATRPLRVDELWEYKPRLMYAGDGTPAHPNQWYRDWFSFMPYQLTAKKYLIPYYVVTVNALASFQPNKGPLDPQRYQMPDQDYEVTIGNCNGLGAHVSVYDPMTNQPVPVQVVAGKSSATQLTVRLKTTDYPRCLTVEEASPGPLIEQPVATANASGVLHLEWSTNIPADSVKVTYGRDWPNRGANEKKIAPTADGHYAVDLPTGARGVLAARISIAAGGLTCSWPRWDEDTQGQVVVPGSTRDDVPPLNFNNGQQVISQSAPTAAGPLGFDDSVRLPVEEKNETFRYRLSLPRNAHLAGPADDREATMGPPAAPIQLRLRYLAGANHFPVETSLPFLAQGDDSSKTQVKLPSGTIATMVDLHLLPASHPGVENVSQKLLFVPMGRDQGDLLEIEVSGSTDAMTSLTHEVPAIFASLQPLAP